jgi:hypothetical protein
MLNEVPPDIGRRQEPVSKATGFDEPSQLARDPRLYLVNLALRPGTGLAIVWTKIRPLRV